MRFYLKLLAAIVVFVGGMSVFDRDTISELAFDLRVAYTYRYGNPAQIEQLIVDTQKRMATTAGQVECFEFGERYRRLRDVRLAEAEVAADGVAVSEEARLAIEAECAREAFGYTRWAAEINVPEQPAQIAKVQSSTIEFASLPPY